MEIARKHFPDVKCKWGDEGLNEIIQDRSIIGVAVVVAAETMVSYNSSLNNADDCIGFCLLKSLMLKVEMSLKMLKAGKHVLQGNLSISLILKDFTFSCPLIAQTCIIGLLLLKM